MTQVSISKAAKLVGVSRSTFYRHIENKGISVSKNNDDKPVIDVSELVRVYGSIQDKPVSDTGKIVQHRTPNETQDLQRKLAETETALNAERQLRQKAEESEAKWQAQAERLTALLTDQRSAKSAQQQSFWKRLFQ